MAQFLEQMDNDSIPKLSTLKATVSQFDKQLVESVRKLLVEREISRSLTKCLTTIAFALPWFAPIDQGIELLKHDQLLSHSELVAWG